MDYMEHCLILGLIYFVKSSLWHIRVKLLYTLLWWEIFCLLGYSINVTGLVSINLCLR